MNILIKLKYSKFYSNKIGFKRQFIYIIFKLIFLINFFIYNFIIFKIHLDRINNLIIKNKNKINYLNISMKEAMLKANKFISISSRGLLINKIPLNINKNPLISVIIPIYNREKTIKRGVRSIQNQKLKQLEIILVNDFSLDNTYNIINELKKEDLRIKVIHNKIHRGTLYSRSIGTLISKGKYIFPLDSDDMYLTEDVFNLVYKDADENNIDIINFKGIYIFNFKNTTLNNHIVEFRNYKKTIIEKQPRLGDNAAGKLSLAGKCIRAKVYKKALKAYGRKRYTIFFTNLEDAIQNFIICQFAKNAKSILKYGVLIIRSKKSDSTSYREPQKNKFQMKYIEALFEFSSNSFIGKKQAFLYINRLLNNKDLIITLEDKKYKNILNSLINKILSSKYISETNKNKIKNKTIFSIINKL